MNAVVQEAYGSSGVLGVVDIERPDVGDAGVLVEVHAASVNALDWHMTRGMPFLLRLDEGIRAPKNRVRGVDLAGRVVAVGSKVARFKPGDEVFGGSNGSFAEYTVTTEDRLALKPRRLDFQGAAALHIGGLTALQGLRDRAGVQPGQRVLINGAGGGVGIYAVQVAKWLGAHVTAVTRTESVDMVRSIGADEVVDHRTNDFTRLAARFDVLFDLGGNRPLRQCCRVLARGGMLVVAGGPAGRWVEPAGRMLRAVLLSPLVPQRVVPFISKNDQASLATVAELAEAGAIRPVIDRVYPLREAPDAIAYVGSGRARGKVVIDVAGR
ncbi:MAG TPA: NAD(P)-dependent alcohol dehydrogenase [Vicinamibacterales bacterium]|nr:NAD(P)-dependent alcohol dehydrogenase [Vicinamibacterales bacterium]